MSHHVGSFPLGLPLRPEREPAPVHVEVLWKLSKFVQKVS